VEDQSRVSTRKLVDSDDEQLRLEELIETAKPPVPVGPEWSHLHYLLSTPFRYPPPSHGSRFRTRVQPGVWYGSQTLDTAIAEVAYWRLRFLNDSEAALHSELLLTAFSVGLRTSHGADLTAEPFAAFEAQISSKTSYTDSQALGADISDADVEMCSSRSARDPQKGVNVAVFSPTAFTRKSLSDASRETWHCYATPTVIEFRSQSFAQTRQLRFRREDFEVEGILPQM
jgi:hypothetical protein